MKIEFHINTQYLPQMMGQISAQPEGVVFAIRGEQKHLIAWVDVPKECQHDLQWKYSMSGKEFVVTAIFGEE